MTIQFERSGGFAGTTQRYSVSLETLAEEDRRKVTELVANAHFFDLPATIRAATGADRFQYKIAISSDQGTHQVQVDQGVAPVGLQSLIDWLQAAARSARQR